MKSVIVANQDGRQLMPLTARRPVCLFEFGGQTLLERAIEGAASAGASEVLILTSPQNDAAVSAAAGRTRAGLPVRRTVWGPTGQADVSDSLWELFMTEDVLLAYADLLCATGLFDTLSQSGAAISLMPRKKEDSKNPPCLLHSRAGTLNGILKKDGFASSIVDPVSLKTALLDSLTGTAREDLPDDGPWITIKTLQDLREAEEKVYPRIEELEKPHAVPAEDRRVRSLLSRTAGYVVTASILLRIKPKHLEAAAVLSGLVSAVLFLPGNLPAAVAGSVLMAGFFVMARAGSLIRAGRNTRGALFGLSPAEITAGLMNFAAMSFSLYRDAGTVSALWAACWILMMLVR